MNESSSSILERFRRSFGKDVDLTLRQPYHDLLAKLGNPQLKLPPVIHVAGTNGKGSTCAFLRAMVEAAGYRAHVYTSPHLVTFHERIRVAGQLVSEDELAGILHECEQLAEPGSVSFFEAATAAAFVAFAHHPADVTILEVGLGGRLDATNVIPQPVATVISRLSFDHRDYLGDTMAAIAREKAGIMRPRTPCFAAFQPSPEASGALQQAAQELDAPLFLGGRDWRVEARGKESFVFTGPQRTLELPMPALAGRHQMENAGLALAASAAFPFSIPDEALRQAMLNVEWPARLQRLKHGRLASLLPAGWELWLDGGHNDSAGEVLAAHMQEWRRQDGGQPRPLFIILGMLSTKVPCEFLAPLASNVEACRTVTIEKEPLSLTADELAALAGEAGISASAPAASLAEGIAALIQPGVPAGRILICGSLYLAGQALKKNQS